MPYVLAAERDQSDIDTSNPDGAYRHVLALTDNRERALQARAEVLAMREIAAAKDQK